MKGRYSGCRMTIYGSRLPGAASIANWAAKVALLTDKAKRRIKVVDWYRTHGKNKSLTARRFGFNRDTVQGWVSRLEREGILGLNDRSRRPKRIRQPATAPDIVFQIVKTRKAHPVWSKYKIAAIMKKQGMSVSASTIGRILKRRGLIDTKVSRKRRKAATHPRARFPHGFKVSCPGDMVQMDTKHIMLPGGRKLYQFTAIDVLTKKRILGVYPSLSSRNGRKFLETCLQSFPFPVKALQTDNGSEFLGEFRKSCEMRRTPHYFIYPRTPKQNSYVEISHGADEREFYQQGSVSSSLPEMERRVKDWERVWNTERPHQSLNYLTPDEYLKKWQDGRLPTKDTITLQA